MLLTGPKNGQPSTALDLEASLKVLWLCGLFLSICDGDNMLQYLLDKEREWDTDFWFKIWFVTISRKLSTTGEYVSNENKYILMVILFVSWSAETYCNNLIRNIGKIQKC